MLCLDLNYLIPNKDTRQRKATCSAQGAALQGSTRTDVPWHNTHLGKDEGTHTQMWSHSHWQILTDPFHGSHASLSLHGYHSSATCLCLTAQLAQTKHPSPSHSLTHSLPCSAGSSPQATSL